ncbi:hypothetical protein COLO4_32337 [Corchorus olitorius]|uniref:Uncharacterized protein n=1 Tax=Corchorus olitorius TaxID=93759 RepID=A0A1R3GZX0_9ROSI|nr:hypothetical protein COLO4_32337 [Corchorus olitorius]
MANSSSIVCFMLMALLVSNTMAQSPASSLSQSPTGKPPSPEFPLVSAPSPTVPNMEKPLVPAPSPMTAPPVAAPSHITIYMIIPLL